VQYAYTEMAGGVNNSRPTSMTYPNGRVLTYNYASGVDSTISRLTSISDSSSTLESYTYLGLDTVVQRAHPQNGINLTYIMQTGDSTGDAGDRYIGLDRFGRVVDQRWLNSSTLAATDRFQYGYDRDSNVLSRNNLVNTAFGELYHASGAGNGYDGLNQLTGFARGTLSASGGTGTPLDTVSSPTHSQSWSLDALGNWTSVTTDGTPQSRSFNQQNEVTAVGSSTLTNDNNGNPTTDQNGNTLVYDAWNRLVQVKNGSTVLSAYSYDGLDRRVTENTGTLTDLYYSTAGQVIEQREGSLVRAQYVWSAVDPQALVERDRDTTGGGTLSERLYVQQDADYNVTALTDTSGNVVERYVYDPYGAPTVLAPDWSSRSSSSYAWVYLFQGGRYDSSSGLYAFGLRSYSPTLGR
jgi:YD repeat-containing protein